MKHIAIRVDSSVKIGSGHLMRCLALGKALRARGYTIHFLSRELEGNLSSLVERESFHLHRLLRPRGQWSAPQISYKHSFWLEVDPIEDANECKNILAKIGPISALVVDHYALGAPWEIEISPVAEKIFVVDDLADRSHYCTHLLDQNLFDHAASRYRNLVPAHAKLLLGPRYALLREEFRKIRSRVNRNSRTCRKVLISIGGFDTENYTCKILESIIATGRKELEIHAVLGGANPHREAIEQKFKGIPGLRFYGYVEDFGSLMLNCDFSIGAAGTTTWERCCLGLPTIALAVAENQLPICTSAGRAGVLMDMGWARDVKKDVLSRAILRLIEDNDLREEMAVKAQALVDGLGTDRVVEAIEET